MRVSDGEKTERLLVQEGSIKRKNNRSSYSAVMFSAPSYKKNRKNQDWYTHFVKENVRGRPEATSWNAVTMARIASIVPKEPCKKYYCHLRFCQNGKLQSVSNKCLCSPMSGLEKV